MKTAQPIEVTSLTGEDLLQALATFCRVNGAPHCYQNWTPETLRDYLEFHGEQLTLVWLTEHTQERTGIVGTGVAWRTNTSTILRRHDKGTHQFDWKPGDPKGDSVFFADFVCVRPGALALILEQFAMRHPTWKDLKWFTYRRKRLIQLGRQHVRAVLRNRKGNHEQR